MQIRKTKGCRRGPGNGGLDRDDFAIMFFSYVFGIDMDENGGLHECIGCPYRTCPDCEKDCKIYKRYQKRLARMEEDKEQERYLQEYAKRKQEKKNRKEGKR